MVSLFTRGGGYGSISKIKFWFRDDFNFTLVQGKKNYSISSDTQFIDLKADSIFSDFRLLHSKINVIFQV